MGGGKAHGIHARCSNARIVLRMHYCVDTPMHMHGGGGRKEERPGLLRVIGNRLIRIVTISVDGL